MNRIENASAQFISAHQDGPAGESDDGVGRWHGETVQAVPPKDLNDILTDAAEEISFEHSERVESKKLEEREIEEQPELPLPPVESILAYLEAATRDDPQEKLKHFVDDLKRNAERGGEGTSPRE